jgi:signal transduction histidine kinase/CheY-like chemotaxis protein/HPt (histidine-containing phosphotransfer) domain-containing protein
MSTANTDRERSLFDAVSFWTGMSSVLALMLVFGASGTDTTLSIVWVGLHAALAIAAALCALTAKRVIRPAWFAVRPAHLILLMSVLLWALGMVFLSDADIGAHVPMLLVATGLACASVWLLHTDLLLMSATQVLLFLPVGFRLLTQPQPQIVTTLLVILLVIVNVLLARRFSMQHERGPAPNVLVDAQTGKAIKGELQAQEAQFQADRLSAELRAELERHKNIEEELKAAKLAAEAASMAKGEFLATMSHEIRTPLNGIIPLLEILRDSKLQPDQRDYLNTAYGSAKQLLSIIDDILDYSKIEANKLDLEQTSMNMREVLDSVMRLMERPAQAKNLKISLKLDTAVRLAVRSDPTRLRQVLTNLVSNAIKFTEKGGVQVEITKRSETRTHQEILFAIKDTGIGISAEAQSKLFKAFQQADTSTTRTFGGTGLGLVICQRIVTLMNGQIGVKSEPGKGSVFWFSVPILKAAGDVGASRKDLNGVRALMISGEQRVTQRFNTLLSNKGMTITTTNSTADGLSKLKSAATLGENWAHELVVVDVNSMRTTVAGFIRNALREPSLERVRFILVQSGEPVSSDVLDARRCASVMLNTTEGDVTSTMHRLLEISGENETRFNLLEEAARMGGGFTEDTNRPSTQAAGQLTGHVLLVEDNPVNRTVALRVVSLIGVSAEAAEHGKEALDKLASGQFDLVLMDCQMPVMDGYTATRTRRTLEDERKLPRIPIIAMTANAMVGDREKCLASGMDDYLTKPLNRGLLEQTMRKWMPAHAKTRSEAPHTMLGGEPTIAPDSAPIERTSMESKLLADLADAAKAMSGFNEGYSEMAAQVPAFVAPVEQPKPAPAPIPSAIPTPVEQTKPAPPSIDRGVFDELLEVMGDEFAALVKVYLEDTPKNLRILAEAAKRGDTDGMVAPAHSLKSTSANLGANRLSDLAKKIETNSRMSTLVDPIGDAKAVIAEFERAASELRALVRI